MADPKGNRAQRRATERQWRREAVPGDPQPFPVTCSGCGTGYLSGMTATPYTAAGWMRWQISRREERPCPSCGRWNAPEGTYSQPFELVREGAHLVARLPREQMEGLLADLRDVATGRSTVQQLRSRATDETIRGFWDLAPKTRTQLIAWIAIIVPVLLFIVDRAFDERAASPEQIQQIIEKVIEEQHAGVPAGSSTMPPPSTPSPEPPLPPTPLTDGTPPIPG